MKKSKRIILGTFLAVSLMASACATNNSQKTNDTQKTKEANDSKSSNQSPTQNELAGTFWKSDFSDLTTDPRSLEIFFLSDGTFHARDLRSPSYSYTPYYVHPYADETAWRLDGEHLELELITHNPDKRVIYNGTYRNNEITIDDFILDIDMPIQLKKYDSMPKLSSIEEDASKLKGEWIEVIQEDYDKYIFTEDYYTPSTLQITGDNTRMTANFSFHEASAVGNPYTDQSFQNAVLELKDEPTFEGSLNEFWHAELTGATESTTNTVPSLRTLTLVNDDMLIMDQEWTDSYEGSEEMDAKETTDAPDANEEPQSDASYESDGEGEDAWDTGELEYESPTKTTRQVFLRKDSAAYQNRKDLPYRNSVLVSNVQELANAIQNDTRIILKGGTYNLSELSTDDSAPTLELSGYSNLSLEAEGTQKVEIVTEDPYEPVISLSYMDNIRLEGLTLGHAVEPGYCSGSVIYCSDVNYVSIVGCYLYGCGTYGVEASNTNHLFVDNTDIYECTYGLLDLQNCLNVAVRNSKLRDSKNLAMISAYQTYDFVIENTSLSGNASSFHGDSSDVFITGNQCSDFVFRNCQFDNNHYGTLSVGNVEFENCTFNDNVR